MPAENLNGPRGPEQGGEATGVMPLTSETIRLLQVGPGHLWQSSHLLHTSAVHRGGAAATAAGWDVNQCFTAWQAAPVVCCLAGGEGRTTQTSTCQHPNTTHTLTRKSTHTYIHAHTRTQTHTCAHLHTHTHTHAHAHTQPTCTAVAGGEQQCALPHGRRASGGGGG